MARPCSRPCAGDAHISVGQLLRLAGAVIVTTPQDLALMDARRGVTLFRTMKARHGPVNMRQLEQMFGAISMHHCTARNSVIASVAGCHALPESKGEPLIPMIAHVLSYGYGPVSLNGHDCGQGHAHAN